MGWFRLFDRMRLRPDTEALQGWGLPGAHLRLTDAHLASYFRDLAANSGVDVVPNGYDIASHLLARSSVPAIGRWHLDLRLLGTPARLLFGASSEHTILSWHEPSARAELQMPGRAAVELQGVDLRSLCGAHLGLRDLATISASVPDMQALGQWLQSLGPFLTRDTRAVIRLPGEALGALVAVLPNWPVKPVALLPCEGDPTGEEAEPRMDLLLCLEALSRRAPQDVAVAASVGEGVTFWHDLSPRPAVSGGLLATALEDSPTAGGLLIEVFGDAPPTNAGAALHGLQRNALRAEPGGFLRLDLTAARLQRAGDALVARTVSGMATFDPFLGPHEWGNPELPDLSPVDEVVARPALLLGRVASRTEALTTLLPRLDLLSELIEQEKLGADGVELVCPDGADGWMREMLALCGFGAAFLRIDVSHVLFSRLILASPAASLSEVSRSAMFDRFWRRVSTMPLEDANWSLTAPRPTGKVMLIGPGSLILNQSELAQLARERRYAVVDPDRAKPHDIAALLRDASVVIAPSRLGVWSALARRCVLGLLHADTDPDLPLPALHAAGARRHNVMLMFSSGVGDDPAAGSVVATDRLAAMMDRMEAMADGMRRGELG